MYVTVRPLLRVLYGCVGCVGCFGCVDLTALLRALYGCVGCVDMTALAFDETTLDTSRNRRDDLL